MDKKMFYDTSSKGNAMPIFEKVIDESLSQSHEVLFTSAIRGEFYDEQVISAMPLPDEKQAINAAYKIKPTRKSKKDRKKNIFPTLLFYFVIMFAIILAVFGNMQSDTPKNILGYSYFTIITKSMQSEIPKGSLVITKQVADTEINVGDDITFFMNDHTVVTHRVIEIYENHNDSGARGFRTKGIENAMPDKEIVYASNIIGVVKFHAAGIGSILLYINKNIVIIAILLGICLILSFVLNLFFEELRKDHSGKKSTGRKSKRKYKSLRI